MMTIAKRVLARYLGHTSNIDVGSAALNVTVDNAEVVLQSLLDSVEDLDAASKQIGMDLRAMTKLLAEHKHNDNLHHNGESILEHTKWVLEDLGKLSADKAAATKQMLSLVALLHDLGKSYTHAVQPEGKITYYGHAEKSVAIAQVLLAASKERLGQMYQRILDLIRLHDSFLALGNDRKNQAPGATKYLNKLLREALYMDQHLDDLVTFAKADSARSKAGAGALQRIEDVLGDIALVEKQKVEQEAAKARQQAILQDKMPELRKLLETEYSEAAQALPDLSKVNAILGSAKRYDLIKQIRSLIGT